MSNCQQGDASVFDCLVNLTFDVDADGAGAFVQQRKLRPETIRSHYQMHLSYDEQICSRLDCILVIKKPGHAHALLFAARQDILPIRSGIPAALSTDDVMQVDHLQNDVQVRIRHIFLTHILQRVRINDLVSQATDRHVGPRRENAKKRARQVKPFNHSKHRGGLDSSITVVGCRTCLEWAVCAICLGKRATIRSKCGKESFSHSR